MNSPIDYLESRIEEMTATLQHVIMAKQPEDERCAYFERDKKLNVKAIESEISGYKRAIKILQQDSEFKINEDEL
jgi:hypothetical protein